MMYRWESFQPLNAAHLVELGGDVEPVAAAQEMERVCRRLGTGPVQICEQGRSIRYDREGGQAPLEVTIHDIAGDGTDAIQRIIDAELARPFPGGVHWPVRGAVLDRPGSPPLLLLVYRHVVSDAFGISHVLRETVRALFGRETRRRCMPVDFPRLQQLFPKELGRRNSLGRAVDALNELTAARDCFRPQSRSGVTRTNVCGIHAAGIPTRQVLRVARELGGTVGDLAFAALFEGLEFLWHDQLMHSRKTRLALCAPVDLRRDAPLAIGNAFGQFLGTLTVRQNVLRNPPFSARLAQVVHETHELKRRFAYRSNLAQLQTMARVWDWSPRWLNEWASSRLIPLAGCISNVNFSEFLEAECSAALIRRYFRFTGTGLLAPMMLGLTTLGPSVSLTTTHHANLFERNEIRQLMAHVWKRLTGQLAERISREEFWHGPPAPTVAWDASSLPAARAA